MNNYNTNFKVKYNDIEKELLAKQTYLEEDVLDICDKLYRDEFLTVFGVDDIDDDNLAQKMNSVLTALSANDKFKLLMTDVAENIGIELTDTTMMNLFMCLFSKSAFHIMHRCVCQQLEFQTIDENLMNELRIEVFR